MVVRGSLQNEAESRRPRTAKVLQKTKDNIDEQKTPYGNLNFQLAKEKISGRKREL